MQYSKFMYSMLEQALNRALNNLENEKRENTRVYVSSKGITVNESGLEGMEQSCPVIFNQDFTMRNVDPYGGSVRYENAPLAAPYTVVVIQGGTSYVNFCNEFYNGTLIDQVLFARMHQISGKTTPSYELIYTGTRVVAASEVLEGNHWVGGFILETAKIEKNHKPADPQGKLGGNVVATNDFITGA